MRLDHLLSREPVFVGNNQHGLLWVCWLFSCARMCSLPGVWVVGVGAFWVGHKCLMQMSTLSGSRSTPCERPPLCGGCPHARPEGFVSWVLGVCGGLFVICIVVASIFVLYCFLCFV